MIAYNLDLDQIATILCNIYARSFGAIVAITANTRQPSQREVMSEERAKREKKLWTFQRKMLINRFRVSMSSLGLLSRSACVNYECVRMKMLQRQYISCIKQNRGYMANIDLYLANNSTAQLAR